MSRQIHSLYYTKAPQLLYIVSHLMNNAVLVYMRADAEQYNYKMYRWCCTYLAAANNYIQCMAYSTKVNGAGEFAPRVVRGSSVHSGDYK